MSSCPARAPAVSPAPSPARPLARISHNALFDASPRPPFYAGASTGQSNFGFLPDIFPSPSKSCSHDLGGLKLLATPQKNASGATIGVKSVHVYCAACKGKPNPSGKDKGKMRTTNRTVSIKSQLVAARALFALHGASLFTNQGMGSGDEEASEEEGTESAGGGGEGGGGGGGGGGGAAS